MKTKHIFRIPSALCLFAAMNAAGEADVRQSKEGLSRSELAQVPKWSREDLDFFLHGSMSTEVVPETVLRTFVRIYPDLFPTPDLSHLGLIPDSSYGWPIGFSRKRVPHLGGTTAVGLNCAACHVAEITSNRGEGPVRVLGATSHFDAEGFFGSVLVATFRTAEAANMKRFLAAYLTVSEPGNDSKAQQLFEIEWKKQEGKIADVILADRSGSKGLAADELHQINESELRLNGELLTKKTDLSAIAHSVLKLFHNIRAALHVPDQPPEKAPPSSGPGRNDAFGLLSAALFGAPQPYAPVKYGLVWNVDQRHWVHWDGNTQSPIGRNLLASLGLGAPLAGKRGNLDFVLIERQTNLSEQIRAPRYPFAIDDVAAKRGAPHFQSRCASCHDKPEGEGRLYSFTEVGTDPLRAQLFTQLQAQRFNAFLAGLEIPGYTAAKEAGIRSTQKYWAASMAGVWARSPYLHNGSVRTIQELLTPPASRAKTFHRGSRIFDVAQMGYTDAGAYVLDTSGTGNSNSGHDYGTDLSADQKRELIEYLKTL